MIGPGPWLNQTTGIPAGLEQELAAADSFDRTHRRDQAIDAYCRLLDRLELPRHAALRTAVLDRLCQLSPLDLDQRRRLARALVDAGWTVAAYRELEEISSVASAVGEDGSVDRATARSLGATPAPEVTLLMAALADEVERPLDLLRRRLGVHRVQLHTAGSNGVDVAILGEDAVQAMTTVGFIALNAALVIVVGDPAPSAMGPAYVVPREYPVAALGALLVATGVMHDHRDAAAVATANEALAAAQAEVDRLYRDSGRAIAENGLLRYRLDRAAKVVITQRRDVARTLADRGGMQTRLADAQAAVVAHGEALLAAAEREVARTTELSTARERLGVMESTLVGVRQQRSLTAVALFICLAALVVSQPWRRASNPETSATETPPAESVATPPDRPRTRQLARNIRALPPIDLKTYAATFQELSRRAETSDYRVTATLRTAEEVEAWIALQAYEQAHPVAGKSRIDAHAADVEARTYFDHAHTTYIQVIVEDRAMTGSFDVNSIAAAFAITRHGHRIRAMVSPWQEPSVAPATSDDGALMRMRLEFSLPTQLPTVLTFQPQGSSGVALTWD